MKNEINNINDTILDQMIPEDFDSFCLPTKGHHTVHLLTYELVKAKSPEHQAYIAVSWDDRETGEVIEARIYSKAVPYFMANVNRQLDGALMGMKLSQVLAYLVNHTISIWVDWDSKYGVQVAYFDTGKGA